MPEEFPEELLQKLKEIDNIQEKISFDSSLLEKALKEFYTENLRSRCFRCGVSKPIKSLIKVGRKTNNRPIYLCRNIIFCMERLRRKNAETRTI